MSPADDSSPVAIDAELVSRLVATQFPEYAELEVTTVIPGGNDNRTFRLGDALAVRLPSAQGYIAAVEKEQRWLPVLAPLLPLPVPTPVGSGGPGHGYPWPWTINGWLDGEPARPDRIDDLERFARDLAAFSVALRGIDPDDGPLAGAHSFHRGAPPVFYDTETRAAITSLSDELGQDRVAAATAVWDAALTSHWTEPPVWFHGDIAWGNLLVSHGVLSAVIDFGTSGVGDPASDLAIAWTLFSGRSRTVFRDAVELDDDTWRRARGWTLWKALITVAGARGVDESAAVGARRVLHEVLADPVI